MAIAARQDPELRARHRAALPPDEPRITPAGQRNIEDLLGFYEVEGRPPVHGRSARGSTLAGWLARRRSQAADGTLSPAYAHALEAIPGWREQPSKRDVDAARWSQRLGEVAAYLAVGNELPRHNKTDDQEERTLGVWLHTQRIDYRAGKFSAGKEKQLDKVIPDGGKGGRGGERTAAGTESQRPEGWS